MFIAIKKTFDKHDDEPWGEYIERKVGSMGSFSGNGLDDYFDFSESFNDRDGVEVGYDFSLIFNRDDSGELTGISCYCSSTRMLELCTQEGGHFENMDEIVARFIRFTDEFNEAIGMRFCFDVLIDNELNGAGEVLLDMTEFRACRESERLRKVASETSNRLKTETGLSL